MSTALLIVGFCCTFSAGFATGAIWCGLSLRNHRQDELFEEWRSILSREVDGFNFYYGYLPGDWRQINVRFEGPDWVAYVGGEPVGRGESKDAAEAAAVAWARTHPVSAEEQQADP